jgi:uncharacterized peroxidase-related enzyme
MVKAVLEDAASAPISEAEKALFAYVEKLNHQPASVRQEDIDRLKAVGWTDEAIYDAATVCALFNFYNRWIDGTGVQDMPAAMYQFGASRMAENGYAIPPPEPEK